ncbi:hypothetical protein KKH14_00530 [Patescibacteria group bacterium]|nr:hypothetical protein [Patescibacteria group bacterium]
MEQDFLKEGKQTKITENILKITLKFTEENFDLVAQILKWIHKNLKPNSDKEIKDKVFRKRTADQIIKDGFTTGCTDIALVFIVLARAKGIPTKYVEAIRNKWMEAGDEDCINGHVLAEIFLNNKWHIIDPTEASLKFWYDRWIVYKVGLDSWDIGIHDFQELKQKFLEFKKNFRAKQIK